ncbi:MAG: type II toxin-antitoxin system RelE/ParE family toxin [Rhodoplanes sp.]
MTTGHISDIIAMKTIILTLSAAKDLDGLPRDAREQVEAGLHQYAMTGQGDVRALQGRSGYRLRIGSYRVIFDEDATTILAIYVGRRATTTYKRS